MTEEEIEDLICEDTIFIEPRRIYDKAIIDVEDQRIVYDYDLLIDIHMTFQDISFFESVEYIEFNTIRTIECLGDYRPLVREKEEKSTE